MARIKKAPPLIKQLFPLSPDNEATLQLFSQVATDHVGRAISKAAIVRALLRYAAQQGAPLVKQLVPLIDEELNTGVMWGTKREQERP
jgi:hypothetical protein